MLLLLPSLTLLLLLSLFLLSTCEYPFTSSVFEDEGEDDLDLAMLSATIADKTADGNGRTSFTLKSVLHVDVDDDDEVVG